jgi:hypothetical protein
VQEIIFRNSENADAGRMGKPSKSTLRATCFPELVGTAFYQIPITLCDGGVPERIRQLTASAAHVEVDSMPLNLLQWHLTFVKLPLPDKFPKFNIKGATETAKS